MCLCFVVLQSVTEMELIGIFCFQTLVKHDGGSMMLNITFMVASLANPHFTRPLNFAGQVPQRATLFFFFFAF